MLHATATVQRAHADAVRGLQGSEQRRWAQKLLSVASEVYGIAQQVIDVCGWLVGWWREIVQMGRGINRKMKVPKAATG